MFDLADKFYSWPNWWDDNLLHWTSISMEAHWYLAKILPDFQIDYDLQNGSIVWKKKAIRQYNQNNGSSSWSIHIWKAHPH